jgi:hypothetical protein
MTAVSASVRPGRLKEFWRYFSENHGAVAGLVLFVAFGVRGTRRAALRALRS